MYFGERYICEVALVKRKKNTLKAGVWQMSHSVSFVKSSACKSYTNIYCLFFYQCLIINNSTFRANNAKTPEFFEDLFCNLVCYEEYRMRTSNRFLREVRTLIIFIQNKMWFTNFALFGCSILEIVLCSFVLSLS